MRNKIEIFKIPHIRNFEGRVNDINPYAIVNLYNMVVLLEVPKEYAIANFNTQNYYFLASDLSDNEKHFFCDFYSVLEYDCLYRIDYNYQQKQTHKILKKQNK